MIYIPIAIAGLALLRCFALEKRARRQAVRIGKLQNVISRNRRS